VTESLRQRLTVAVSERSYAALRSKFQGQDGAAAYRVLFPIAVDYRSDGADGIAAQLLVEIEPRCPVSCEEALLAVASARWQVSDERVPFYLLCQFGRRELFETIGTLLAANRLDAKQANSVDTVGYWARLPTLTLAERIREYAFTGGAAAG
jgi:hypothetical protein